MSMLALELLPRGSTRHPPRTQTPCLGTVVGAGLAAHSVPARLDYGPPPPRQQLVQEEHNSARSAASYQGVQLWPSENCRRISRFGRQGLLMTVPIKFWRISDQFFGK